MLRPASISFGRRNSNNLTRLGEINLACGKCCVQGGQFWQAPADAQHPPSCDEAGIEFAGHIERSRFVGVLGLGLGPGSVFGGQPTVGRTFRSTTMKAGLFDHAYPVSTRFWAVFRPP